MMARKLHKTVEIWSSLSLTLKGFAIAAVPVSCTLGMLLLVAEVQRRFESSNQWVIHTEQVLSQSRDLLAASLSAEATARGYLLTRDLAFLEIHKDARRKLAAGFTEILRLTGDNPGQQEHMRHALRLMNEEIIALDAQIGGAVPSLTDAVNTSRRRIDTVRAEIDDFEAEERRLLGERRRESLMRRDMLRLGLWAFCFVGAMSAVAGAILFTGSVRRRLERIVANAGSVAARESYEAVDGSRDAIGRLELTLIATTRNLLDREQRLADNAVELERAKLAAEAAVKAKTEFVANVSHEIRSPMSALLGAAELLGATPLAPKQVEYVKILDRAGNNLLSVINEVLDHAKIEAGRLELESVPFELAAVLDRVASVMSVAASEKGLELLTKLAPGLPRRVIGDPERLQRVLINLVSNAIKFTEVGIVAIRVEPSNVGGLARFSVADTGIGIPRERQEAVFQKFTQAESSTTRQYGGTGLGLAIVKHIVGLMGGRIWVESEAGQGSTFHFTAALPAAAEPVPLAPRPASPSRRPRRLAARILLADDSPPSVALIRAYLAETKCVLEVAGDGEAALARLCEASYNLVLMDVQMPKLDGYEVTQRFREWERAQARPRTPIVAVTAHAFLEDVERALKAGADAQLTKPFRRESLLETIELQQRGDNAANLRVSVPDYLREIAPEFLRRQRNGLLSIVLALESGEFDPIQTFAHNMKGCGKSFGFPRLTELGREMERAAKECDAGGLHRQIEELREYLNEVDVA